MDNPNPLAGMSRDEAFLYVYEKAKEYGDKFPELVAAQWALESGYGKSMPSGTNNPFGQTTLTPNGKPAFKGKNGRQFYWKKYDSIDDAIKYRSSHWGSKYKDAKTPIEALSIIQPKYAPTAHDNGGYMSSIATIMSDMNMYDGMTDIPNADVDPEFYEKRTAVQNMDDKQRRQVLTDYLGELEKIEKSDLPENMKQVKRNALNRDMYEKGYITNDGPGRSGGLLNDEINKYNQELQDKRNAEIKAEAEAKKLQPKQEKGVAKPFDNLKRGNIARRSPLVDDRKESEPNHQNIKPSYSVDKIKNIGIDPLWDEQIDNRRIENTPQPEGGTTPEGGAAGGSGSGTPTQTEEKPAEEQRYAGDDWYNFMPEQTETDINYNPDDFQDKPPVGEMLASTAGTIIGLKEAQKPLPERDEQVSDAYRQYAHEMKMLSERGLRPEDEAYAKNMLAESYSQSVHNLTRMSGGNRNQLLAGMGRIDAQNAAGMASIAVEDARAKNEALFKYGEAMQFINNFDANRDIANNEREFQNAMLSKEAGAELAGASMANFMNELQYWRENRPGSANHAMRSMMSRRLFGVDPMLKDDGTGNTKWTMSWREKENKQIAANNERFRRDRKLWASMDDEQKSFIDDFNKRTNFEYDSDIIDYVAANRDTSSYEPRWDRLPEINSDNFGSLFEAINQNQSQ